MVHACVTTINKTGKQGDIRKGGGKGIERTVNAIGLQDRPREKPGGEHVYASNAEALRAHKHPSGAGFFVRPRVACASVEEDRYEEEIEEAFALLGDIDASGSPGLKQGLDAGLTGIEVAPSAVRRDLGEKATLASRHNVSGT